MGPRAPLSILSAVTALSCNPIVLYHGKSESPAPATTAASSPAPSDDRTAHGNSLAIAMHTGTVVPAKHPDRVACAPFEESTNAACVTGFVGPIVVTDIDFGSNCDDELMVLAVSAASGGKIDVSHPHWYLSNPAHAHLAVHGANFVVEPTDELVFAARPTTGAATPTGGSGCFVTWSSKGPANPASVYPRLE